MRRGAFLALLPAIPAGLMAAEAVEPEGIRYTLVLGDRRETIFLNIPRESEWQKQIRYQRHLNRFHAQQLEHIRRTGHYGKGEG